MKEGLSNTFKMKDMGQLHFCLGINFEVTQGISLCQKQYLLRILEKYRLSEVKLPKGRNVVALLAFAAEKKLQVHQMDVVSAFLNGDLTEEIYMKQPPGYVQSGKEELVGKLRKSIYGLKQSPRCWNEKLCNL